MRSGVASTLVLSLIGGMLAACSGGSGSDSPTENLKHVPKNIKASTACVAWVSGGTYTAGEVVTYNGATYTALVNQTDYAGTGWNPTVASLYSPGGSCSGSPAPTPTPTPAPTPTPTPAPTPTPTPAPAPTPTPTPSATLAGLNVGANYVLVNPESGLALDVTGAGTTNLTNVEIWTQNGSPAQVWKFVANSNGTYTLVNPNSNMALDIYSEGTANGTNVDIYTQNSTAAQQWKIQTNSNGTFTLVNPNSGAALDVAGCGTSAGTNVQIWANGVGVCNGGAGQQWVLQPAGVTSGTTYTVVNPNSNMALDIYSAGTANGSNVDIYTQNGTAAQQWQVDANGDGTYHLINPNSGKALDVAGCGTGNGTNVDIYTYNTGACNSGAGQKWRIDPNTNGTYTLVNPESGAALDVAGCGTTNLTNVQIWADGVGVCNSGAGQQWKFNTVTATPTPTPTPTPAPTPTPTPVVDGYTLVWQDVFANDSTLDTTKWQIEVNDSGEGNNELEYYTNLPQNIFLQNGNLVIQALSGNYTGSDGQTRAYTSGRMHTLANWTYGRFEASIKLPSGQGTWPAFWMMPQNSVYGTWAASGEIDIMEAINLGGAGGNNLYGSIHYGGAWPNDLDTTVEYTPAANMTTGFHTYAVEWDPGQIRWYIDNILYSTQTNWSSTGGAYPAPFNQGFYIILNLAIGGNWPGSPNNNAIFPQQMQVQYVKVYQKQ